MIKNYIKEKRELHNLTQQDLGDLVGVSRQTIISIEKGSYNPSLELAFKLAHVLKVDIETLFKWEASK